MHKAAVQCALAATSTNVKSLQFDDGIVASHRSDGHRYWWKVCQGQLNMPQWISLTGNTQFAAHTRYPHLKT